MAELPAGEVVSALERCPDNKAAPPLFKKTKQQQENSNEKTPTKK